MRIIACSDLHGNYDLYQWIVELNQKLDPDLIVICGDLFGYPVRFPSLETAQQADGKKISQILTQISKPILYIMGNDDFVPFRPKQDNIYHIHSKSLTFGNFNFIGYQYSLPFVGGIYEKSESKIGFDLKKLSHLVNKKTILISHSPAYGILDKSFSGIHCGSKSILNFIEKEELHAHLHGHIHEAFGQHRIHFNVAAGRKKQAMLIDLNTLAFEILE
jgi:Icc-related predicted phosphoesterase